MYVTDIQNNYFANKNFVGFLGEVSDLQILIPSLNLSVIKDNKKVKRVIKNDNYLKELNLDESILSKKIGELSSYEYKCILLIKALIENPKIIILNNFDLGIPEKYKSKLSNFLKKINANNNINFIIISNDVLFQNLMCKHYVIMKNKIIKYQGDLINAIKQGFINKPEIIKFIDLANSKKKANLDYTLDSKELLKAIYRSVF